MSGTITEIRRDPEDEGRVTVFIDGVEAFTVSEVVAAGLGLSVGREFGVQAAQPTAACDDRTKAREAALRLLAVRARSGGELSDRLRQKGFSDELTAAVVTSLTQVGLVDDQAFARAWAEERVRLRPVGPRRLTQELLSRKIDKDLTARVVDETFREHPELELARRAVEKKTRVSGGADGVRRRARLHSFLIRRGFSYEVASALLKEIEGETDA